MSQQEQNIHKSVDEMVKDCVTRAVKKSKGFAGFSGNITDSISRNILGIDMANRGIKYSIENDEDIAIDLYIIVSFGTKIPQLAWEIQKKVKKEIEIETSLLVKYVNIHVQSVVMPGE